MDSISRLYLDANIFIRIFEGSDDVKAALFELLVTCEAHSLPFLTTSELTFAEVLVDPYRRKDEQLIQLYDNWTISNSILEVGPVSREALYYAAVLRALHKSLKLPDAIHLSTAFGFECSHFLTSDERLAGEYQLSNTRYGVTKGVLVLKVLRPTIDVIKSLIAMVSK